MHDAHHDCCSFRPTEFASEFRRSSDGISGSIERRIRTGIQLVPLQRQRDTAVFLASSLFFLLMLASVTFGMYPYILVSTTDPTFNLTVFTAAADSYGLTTGIVWFGIGFMLVLT